jgi:F0F1-type ATP synthase membrane subunit a
MKGDKNLKAFWTDFLNRLWSPVTIPAVLALIYFILTRWCGIAISGWEDFTDLLMLIIFGVAAFNNPTNKTHIKEVKRDGRN